MVLFLRASFLCRKLHFLKKRKQDISIGLSWKEKELLGALHRGWLGRRGCYFLTYSFMPTLSKGWHRGSAKHRMQLKEVWSSQKSSVSHGMEWLHCRNLQATWWYEPTYLLHWKSFSSHLILPFPKWGDGFLGAPSLCRKLHCLKRIKQDICIGPSWKEDTFLSRASWGKWRRMIRNCCFLTST